MADSYHIIDGQVVPFHGGRKDTDTGAWRDATPMELQLQSELCAAERALEEASAALEEAREDAARLDFIERTYSGMTNRERYLPVQMIWGKGCNGRTLREACDKYMEREARNG